MALGASPSPLRPCALVHGLGWLVLATAPALAESPVTIICVERADADATRVVIELDPAVRRFFLTTPEFLWRDPAQPETPRIPAGKTDTSPDLAGRVDVALDPEWDAVGQLKALRFAVTVPDALELAGLRGSLLLHEDWRQSAAAGSLHYAATGNLDSVTPVQCRRFDD
jgi:hypothetical protein